MKNQKHTPDCTKSKTGKFDIGGCPACSAESYKAITGLRPKAVLYEIENLGRSKWSGEVKAQTKAVEHVEAALIAEAQKHLMSKEIDFNGDVDAGEIIVGGFRVVGKYRRKGFNGEAAQ